MYIRGKEVLKRYIISKRCSAKLAEKTTDCYVNKGMNELNKKFTSSKGSGINLTNTEIRDIMKVINYLENRGILLKGTTKKLLVKNADG